MSNLVIPKYAVVDNMLGGGNVVFGYFNLTFVISPFTRRTFTLPKNTQSTTLKVTSGTCTIIFAQNDLQVPDDNNTQGALLTVPYTVIYPSGGDDSAQLIAASTAGLPIIATAGNYNYPSQSISINVPYIALHGAIATIGSGFTLTFNSSILAGRWQIFNNALAGQGTIVVSNTVQEEGFPEWFGAQINNSNYDCAPAIQACVIAFVETTFQAETYYIGTTGYAAGSICIKIQNHGKKLKGKTQTQNLNAGCTILAINSGYASGIQVGYDAYPGPPSTWLESVNVEDITIWRAKTILNPLSGIVNSPTGLILKWATNCRITKTTTLEHSIGFYIYGTVECFFTDCKANRFTAGQNLGNDFFTGYFTDGTAASTFNSGSASLYLDRCQAFSNYGAGGNYTLNAAYQGYEGFTDTFIDRFEAGNVGYGVLAGGTQTTSPDYLTEDFRVTNSIFDGVINAGVSIQIGASTTDFDISNNYVGLSNAGGAIGLECKNTHGSGLFANNQVIGVTGNNGIGISFNNCSGVTSKGNRIIDVAAPIVLSNNCFTPRFEGDRINVSRVTPTTEAILSTGTTGGIIDVDINSSNGALFIPRGITLAGAGNQKMEIKVSGIYSTSITGGVANKLWYNGASIGAAGVFGGTNLASGNFV